MNRVYNFSAGPAVLPLEVLEEASRELPNFRQGMSILEMSHRGATYSAIHEEARTNLRELLAIPETHDILFLQGGGHLQFAMVPLNLLGAAAEATYIVNGVWSKKAATEAAKFCHVDVITSDYGHGVPPADVVKVPNDAAYLYYCQNETVNGLEFNYIPPVPDSCRARLTLPSTLWSLRAPRKTSVRRALPLSLSVKIFWASPRNPVPRCSTTPCTPRPIPSTTRRPSLRFTWRVL